jgi:hypothetical protein
MPTLTDINLDDLVSSFGWQDSPRLASALRAVFRAPAEKFARQVLDFDRFVGETDLPTSSRRTIPTYVQSVRVFGRECAPDSGPALFLSNHPGMADTLALFCAINRSDLRAIGLDRPFLQSLPNITHHLFFIGDDPAERMRAVRQTASHLRAGGSVLTFPAGEIEPDPNVYDGALESLDNWTDSAGVFVRFAPETKIVPTLVRGVLWDKAVKHPLTRLKRNRFEREKLGAAFQLLAHILFDLNPVHITVQFAPPVTVAETGSTDVSAIHAKVIERMRELVKNPPVGEGISIL